MPTGIYKHKRGYHHTGVTKEQHYCKECGSKIGVTSALYGSGLCSSCSKRGDRHPGFKDGRTFKKYFCKECGREICYDTALSGSTLCKSCCRKGTRHTNYIDGRTKAKHYCVECGKIISYQVASYGTGLCGICCKKGNRNPSWNNGSSFEQYPSSFNRQLKEKVRVRDNFICQKCGIPELECGQRLDIHHIDYNKNNCEIDNLISLCHNCHSKIGVGQNYWKNFFIGKEKINASSIG